MICYVKSHSFFNVGFGWLALSSGRQAMTTCKGFEAPEKTLEVAYRRQSWLLDMH